MSGVDLRKVLEAVSVVAARSTIAALWAGYAREYVPVQLGAHQRAAVKLAFYAGVGILLTVMREGIGSDQVAEDEGVDILQRWADEVEAHLRGTGKN